MYLYGVSLGGIIQTHYMLEDNANTPYSGMVSYGVPFKPDESLHAFKSNGYGFYDWFLGLFINLWARTLIDDLAKFTSKEKMEIYRNGLYNESFRLTSFDTHFIAPMFGFKDSMEYYKAGRIADKLHKIKKCPTMFLEAWDDVLMAP